mgnify:CR=1 FL=1
MFRNLCTAALLVLLLVAYAIGIGIGWAIWGLCPRAT